MKQRTTSTTPDPEMTAPFNPHDESAKPPEPPPGDPAWQPAGMVPAAGKHAARPSEAERHQALHEYPQTDEEALRRKGITPGPDLYRDPPGQ